MTKAEQLESLLKSMDSGTDVLGYKAPVIGISGNFREGDCTLAQGYYMSVLEAGGTPAVIPSYDNEKALVSILDTLDGLVLSGGADIDPDYLGEEPLDCISVNPRRDAQELMLVRLAVERLRGACPAEGGDKGTLFSAGLVAGEGLCGIVLALLSLL